jgi:hypothetical protein
MNPVVWIPPSQFALAYDKHPATIRQWCITGFIVEMGYQLKRDVKGHWFIGVPMNISRARNARSASTLLTSM